MNQRIDKVWNDAACQTEGLRWLSVNDCDFSAGLPLGLSKLPGGVEVTFRHCKLGPFTPEALQGEGKLTLRFQYCEGGDFHALREHAIVHGLGRCELEVFQEDAYERDKSWQTVYSLGPDFVGDEDLRHMGFGLRRYGHRALKAPATPAHLELMRWSRKPIRTQALEYLEAHWPNPIEQRPDKAAFYLMGKPTYHALGDLKEAMAAAGFRVVTKPDKATHALLLDQPKDKLQMALDAGLPIALEQHLKPHLEAAAEPALELSAHQGENLAEMLLNADMAVVASALELLRSVELSAEVLTNLVLVMMFCEDKKLKKAARLHVLGHAPEAVVNRFQADRRNYGSLTDGKKLLKLAKEMEGLGLDGAQFSRGIVTMICVHGRNGYMSDEVLTAALHWPQNNAQVFKQLASAAEVYLPPLKGAFPAGLSDLASCTRLRVQGRHKSADNVDELARMPKLHTLEYWCMPARLDLLAPLQDTLRGFEFRGQASQLTTAEELGRFRKLEVLSMGNTQATDLSPLAGLPLRRLAINEVPVTDLGFLETLGGLDHLNLQRVPATDFSPLRALTNLGAGLDLGFCKMTDLSLLEGMQSLRSLSFWGQSLDLAQLPVLASLESLNMPHCRVEDLLPLTRQPKLRSISATRLAATPEAVAAFRAAAGHIHLHV